MAGEQTVTTFAYGLKTVYDTGKVLSTVYQDNPALARMPKSTKFPGAEFDYSVRYAPISGRSEQYQTAKANRAGTKGVKFRLTRAHDYANGSITIETILASEDDIGALQAVTETEAEGAMEAMSRIMGITVYGDGSGVMGTVESPGASTTLTLESADDITNFEVGQNIVFAADADSALRDSGEALEIEAINRSAGTMTVSANVTTIASIADGDSIFIEGDYATAEDRNKMVGFDGWNPATAPSAAESFFGVDRSVDVERLSGHRYTSTTDPGLSTYEAIQLVASRIARSGQKCDTAYMGFDRFRGLVNSAESRVIYNKDPVTTKVLNSKGKMVAELGFEAVTVHGPKGPITVVPDQNCGEETIYVQKLDSWELKSIGEAPRWLVQGQSGRYRAEENASDDDPSVEFKLAYFGNVRCKLPVANGRYDFL